MQIVSREELLKMSSGTVYTLYEPEYVDGKIHIMVDKNCNLDLVPTFDMNGEKERHTSWMTDDTNIIADYDSKQLFAVFNKAEIIKMTECLQWALTNCSTYFDMDTVFVSEKFAYQDEEWMPEM